MTRIFTASAGSPMRAMGDGMRTVRQREHQHEWSALWSHFGEYGDQDAHFHVCVTENDHPAPGYPANDCKAMLVGKGRDCVDGQAHEVRLPAQRVRHG